MSGRTRRVQWIFVSALSMGLMGCPDDGGNASGTTGTETQGQTQGTGDCQPGTEYCSCLGGSVCEGDLACIEGFCVMPGGPTSGTPTSGESADADSGTSNSDTNDASTSESADGDSTDGSTGEDTNDSGDSSSTGEPSDPFDCESLEYPVNIVDGGGYNTVAAAVTAAPPDATVQVCPGTYVENIYIERNLTLIGSGAATTIIDGGGVESVLFLDGVDLTLEGLTITNGQAHLNPLGGGGTCGGGLAIEYSGGQVVNISDCVFTGNFASRGAGICSDGLNGSGDGDITLTNVLINNNEASVNGGGIFTYSDLFMTDTEVIDNIAVNHGGGLYLSYGAATVTGGIVRNNTASEGGGAYIQDPYTLDVTNSDWGESEAFENDPDDVGCYVDTFGFFGANATFSCSVPEYDVCNCG